MEDAGGALEAARDAYRRHDRAGARGRFTAARAAGQLTAADLEAPADAAWWLGDVEEASAVLEDARRRHLEDGRPGLRPGPSARPPWPRPGPRSGA